MRVERRGADVVLHPEGPLVGEVELPGSKSLTNRYLLCTALADGVSVLRGASLADDAHRMLDGLARLGVSTEVGRDGLHVRGARGHLPAGAAELELANAGTAMRFLAALCCLGSGAYRLDGSPRMRQRPIGQLVDALVALGAAVEYEQVAGYPPLCVRARGLAGGQVTFDRPVSSQYASALLMVAPYCVRDVYLRIDGALSSRPYVAMTVAVLRELGVEVLADACAQRYVVPAGQRYRAGAYSIEPDASAASYFWAAAAVSGGSVRVRGLSGASAQGDVGFARVLEQMGCTVDAAESGIAVSAPRDGVLRGGRFELGDMPDVAQTLAVTALFACAPVRIEQVASLRIKETDRLAALQAELTKLGADVRAGADFIEVSPPADVTPAAIDTYEDHRMAMSFAVAGARVAGITIRDAACVSKSVPDFFERLAGPARG